MNDDIWVAEIQEWAQGLEEIRGLIGGEFARAEPRNNAVSYIRGLLSDEERKNSWTLSERAGHGTPDGMQRLLSTTDWDPEAVRDALFGYVKKHLGDPKGILAIDETGFLKKGTASAGVARQYSGTAGRVENCQIGVFLTYASPAGRTFLDRELYLPKAWTDDAERCKGAGIPEDRVMATKPELAAEMIERALDAGIEAEWTTGDAVYGQHTGLRRRLEARGMHYVMAVPMNQRAITPNPGSFGAEGRADQLFAALDGRAWRTRTAGTGTKGERLYSWARIRINGPAETWYRGTLAAGPPLTERPHRRGLLHLPHTRGRHSDRVGPGRRSPLGHRGNLPNLQRRNRTRPLPGTAIHRLVPAHHSFHVRPRVPQRHPLKKGGPHPGSDQLVRLSLPEIRHLITRIAWHQRPEPSHVIRCSLWRRKHQHRAQQCHYRARGHTPQTQL